ncbi:MAG: hypothetical protein JST92_10420 [Deltaproteobacteria bacterium]|nr:hypothetical protein [Deltaproteobacteria bacterium]
MERLLATLERRLGRYAPPNIILPLVVSQLIAYFFIMTSPRAYDYLTLTRSDLLDGEWWRLITFLAMPWSAGLGSLGMIMTVMSLVFLYFIGNTLESEWGTFRFDVFYLVGVLGAIACAFIVGGSTNYYLNESLFLAFATLFPDYQILLIIIPVRVKWLGWLTGATLIYQFITGTMAGRAGILISLAPWFLFCFRTFVDHLQGRVGGVQSRGRRNSWRQTSAPVERAPRVCALCGKSERDDPNLEFRVCECEKCGGKATTFCLAHAKNH